MIVFTKEIKHSTYMHRFGYSFGGGVAMAGGVLVFGCQTMRPVIK